MGTAIDLSDISKVSEVYEYKDYLAIQLYFKGKDSNHTVVFYREKYLDDSKALLKKVQKLRMDLIKIMNDGVDAVEMAGSIDLKKRDGRTIS